MEKRFQVFIDSISNYFIQLHDDNLIIDTPFLQENYVPVLSDYTGVIGITGNNKGLVYFTAPLDLLNQMLSTMKESDHSEENLVDLVGEVANTIAGNARTEFGDAFNIAVPMVFKGRPEHMILPKDKRSFIMPITWKKNNAAIVIYLQP